jgi:hypothetical protein
MSALAPSQTVAAAFVSAHGGQVGSYPGPGRSSHWNLS